MAELFALTANPKSEVRKCGSCGAEALICYQAWAHSFNRRQTGSITRSCRCQACGAYASLRDPKSFRTLTIISWVLVWTVVFPLMLFPMIYLWKQAWRKNPLVPGAPYPVIRYQSGPRDRRCGSCQQVARLTNVTRHSTNGIPTGTTYKFACEGCKRVFTTENLGGTVFNLFFILFFGAGGLLMLVTGWNDKDRSVPWVGAACAAGGAVFLYITVKKLRAAWGNPEIESPHLMA